MKQITLNSALSERELSENEKVLVENTKQAALLVGLVLQNRSSRNELQQAVALEYGGDVVIPFKDILNSKGSSFLEKYNVTTHSFAEDFLSMDKEVLPISEYLIENEVVIYAPYQVYFDFDKIENITVTWHPLDQDVENIGYVFDLSENGKFNHYPVLVNDEYSLKNATIIIKVDDPPIFDNFWGNGSTARIEPINDDCLSLDCDDPYGDNPNDNPYGLGRNYTCSELDGAYVQVGFPKIRLKEHWDRWFSGASEVVLVRASGKRSLQANGEQGVGITYPIVRMKIKRSDINDGYWKDSGVSFYDTDWKIEETEQIIHAIDEDAWPAGNVAWNGVVNIGVNESGEPSYTVAVGVNFSLDENYVRGNSKYKFEYDRCQWLENNARDHGFGRREGWTIYSAHGLSFT